MCDISRSFHHLQRDQLLSRTVPQRVSHVHCLCLLAQSALNMVSCCMAVDLEPDGILCMVIHPGCVCTDMGGSWGKSQTRPTPSAALWDLVILMSCCWEEMCVCVCVDHCIDISKKCVLNNITCLFSGLTECVGERLFPPVCDWRTDWKGSRVVSELHRGHFAVVIPFSSARPADPDGYIFDYDRLVKQATLNDLNFTLNFFNPTYFEGPYAHRIQFEKFGPTFPWVYLSVKEVKIYTCLFLFILS